MSITLDRPRSEASMLTAEDARQFLYREARYLDDKEWESWLELYAPDAEFWMPSWDDDDQLVAMQRALAAETELEAKEQADVDHA